MYVHVQCIIIVLEEWIVLLWSQVMRAGLEKDPIEGYMKQKLRYNAMCVVGLCLQLVCIWLCRDLLNLV